MSNYINVIAFILTTYSYYLFFKPALTYDKISNEKELTMHFTNSYTFLAIYFFAVVIIQCIVNMNVISEKCGGSASDNIGYAGIITIVPWTLIFGILLVVLTIYPGFKSAFSDVIGYYWVSYSANKLITELLIDRDVEQNISQNMPIQNKADLERAADAIIKICGNSAVLVNQMTPNNFQNFWEILNPLKKTQYRSGSPTYNQQEAEEKRNKLFDLVVTKDNIGEAMWFIYTGLLVTAVVQLKISSKGCVNNVKTMEANYQKFKDEQKTKDKTSSENIDYNSVNLNVKNGLDTANTGSEYAIDSNTEQNNL
jgi:hypothetical protein